MEFRKQSHAVYHCQYHLVFPTKYRRKIFNNGIMAYMNTQLAAIKKYYPEIDCQTVNHEEDHVHLLVSIPPKMSVGSVVRIIKSNTAKSLKTKFPFLKQVYWGTDGIWSEGYFVSTVGVNEEVIRAYIARQGNEDEGQPKVELGDTMGVSP